MCLFLRAEEKDEKAEVQVGRRYIAFTVAVKLTESLRCCSSASRRPVKEEEEEKEEEEGEEERENNLHTCIMNHVLNLNLRMVVVVLVMVEQEEEEREGN